MQKNTNQSADHPLASQALSHAAFMQFALYDPVHGYYMRRASLGETGDFSTSATLCPAFAEAVSKWVRTAAQRLCLKSPWPVIELGAGDGSLAANLVGQFQEGEMSLHLVETSPALMEKQIERLGSATAGHYATLKDALKATEGLALIVANEFPDAFPAVQLCWTQDGWREVCVCFDAHGEPTERLREFTGGVDAEAPRYPRPGQRIFVHPGYHLWLQANLPALRRGAMLTLDYGRNLPAQECRAYAGQERYEGLAVYRDPGQRDITCDLNFSDLRRWGEELGLQTRCLETQRDFFLRYLPHSEAREREEEALAFLMQPLGAGGALMALEQERE